MEAAVAAIIESGSGEVLLARADEGPWEFPRGRKRADESYEAAMRRVAEERLGVSVDIHTGQPPVPGDYEGRPAVYRFFLARVLSGTPAARDYAELRWFGREALQRVESDALTRQVIAWYREGNEA